MVTGPSTDFRPIKIIEVDMVFSNADRGPFHNTVIRAILAEFIACGQELFIGN
jgi:hypothetical protein